MNQVTHAQDPRASRYDVVVVGGGVGGLTAGALLAKAGVAVLVVEAADGPGGCVRAFERGGFVWDPAVHLVLNPPQWKRLFDHLGVTDAPRFDTPDFLWRTVADELELRTPAGREAYIEAHADLFPGSADEVRRFLNLSADLHRLLHAMMTGGGGMEALQRLQDGEPDLLRLRLATLAEVVDLHVHDPDARAILSLPGLYLGLPPSRLAFSAYSQMIFSHAVDGAFLVDGGVQRLVDALASGLERHGGELVTGREVTRIGVSEGEVRYVELDRQDRIETATVLSNADPMQTFGALLEDTPLPRGYRRKLDRGSASDSTFTTFLATHAPLERHDRAAHLVHYSTSTDVEAAWQASFEGRGGYASVAIPTLDGRVGVDRPHQVVATTSAPYDAARPWSEARSDYAASGLAVLERLLPGAGAGKVFHETATPRTVERHTRNRRGAQFAWGNGVDGVGSRSLDQVTPIGGLYLAGSWTNPGSGFVRAAVTGRIAALRIAQKAGIPLEVTW